MQWTLWVTTWSLLLPLSSAFPSCLYSRNLNSVNCSQAKHSDGLIEPTFIAYRAATHGSTERRCRFEPTCSRFLIEAIHYYGLPKGILYGFARAQLRHDDNFQTLEPTYRNGFALFLDPVENWNRK